MQKKGESQRIGVAGVGENSLDLLATVPRHPAPNEKLELLDVQSLPGGQVASALVACARQGCAARYVGTFGDDDNGRIVEAALGREGVDIASCRRVHAANRAALILVDAVAGTRTVLWRRDPALRWPSQAMTSELIAGARVLLVDATDLEAAIAAAQAARQFGVTVVADVDAAEPGLDRLLAFVDVLIVAEAFPQAMTGEASLSAGIRALHSRFRPSVVIATLAAAGAVAWDDRDEVASPGFVVPVVDTTGAGDAFRGGFIAGWLETAPAEGEVPALGPLLDRANATAALNCRAVGAQTGLPTRTEVLALLTDLTVPRSNSHGHGRARRGGR
jgi:sugar/nucleoside kinase (ribokinase family)